ncbi:MAG: GGDEF domain-containing protein [Planctomycetota bacterium]|nr:MAG: GGDEF domain-containing protein [Planctomycetota bacterium]
MRKRLPIFLFLFFFPALVLALVTAWRFSGQFMDAEYFPGFVAIISALAAGLSIFALGLILYIAALWKRVDDLERTGKQQPPEFVAATRDLTRRLTEKSKEVELLAAMREVSLLATSHVEFEKVLDGALAVLEGVFNARDITIFLSDKSDSKDPDVKVTPKASRAGGKTLFGADVPENIGSETVTEAIRMRRRITSNIGHEVIITLPIIVDEELLGAVRLSVPESELPVGGAEVLERRAESLIYHIGLAIKTPTLYDRAVVDSLTRLYTRRHFTDQLGKYFGACRRLGQELALILVDLDHFKKVNDTYGHVSGDNVLRGVAAVMKASVREYDTCYRYGGEELSILLPGATLSDALVVAERVREGVEGEEFRGEKNEKIPVTVSAGVATYIRGMTDSAELITAADTGLYSAKEAGRNCVVTIQEEAPRGAAV